MKDTCGFYRHNWMTLLAILIQAVFFITLLIYFRNLQISIFDGFLGIRQKEIVEAGEEVIFERIRVENRLRRIQLCILAMFYIANYFEKMPQYETAFQKKTITFIGILSVLPFCFSFVTGILVPAPVITLPVNALSIDFGVRLYNMRRKSSKGSDSGTD